MQLFITSPIIHSFNQPFSVPVSSLRESVHSITDGGGGYTLDRANNHLTPAGALESLDLPYMLLDSERKPKYFEKAHV